jgi:hypothetical protein
MKQSKKKTRKGKGCEQVSSAVGEELIQQALLVVSGLREGYLLEGVTMYPLDLKEFLEDGIRKRIAAVTAAATTTGDSGGGDGTFIPSNACLLIIPLGFADMVLVERERFIDKLSTLEKNDCWIGMNQPLLINLNDERAPSLCSKTDMVLFADLIRKSIPPSSIVVTATAAAATAIDGVFDEISKTSKTTIGSEGLTIDILTLCDTVTLELSVGYPFIAGWLLGYVCIYHSITAGGGSALIGEELEKVSIHASTSTAPAFLSIMEFTCPVSIFEEDQHRRRVFEVALSAKVAAMTCKSKTQRLWLNLLGPPSSSEEILITVERSTHRPTAVTL